MKPITSLKSSFFTIVHTFSLKTVEKTSELYTLEKQASICNTWKFFKTNKKYIITNFVNYSQFQYSYSSKNDPKNDAYK